MRSARMKTPPAVRREDGLIPRMQRGYARLLRASLEHRGRSVACMLLVVAVSLVPMTQTKFDMFGGGEAGELQLFYQWKGSYTLGQVSEEVARVERYLDENRDEFRITQVYSWFGEQGNAGTMITLDPSVRDSKPIAEAISAGLPTSARANIGVRGSGDQGGGMGQNVQVQLVGDSMQALRELAEDVVPILSRRPELRDVRLDVGDQVSELAVRVDRERAAAFGFSADQVAGFVGLALRGSQLREYRRGQNEVPVWVRFAGAENFDHS